MKNIHGNAENRNFNKAFNCVYLFLVDFEFQDWKWFQLPRFRNQLLGKSLVNKKSHLQLIWILRKNTSKNE